MLARKQRLPKTAVEKILKKGRKFSNNFFTAKHLRNQESFNRFCVVVSTKIEAKATKRNRLRRQLYEIFRHYKPQNTNHHHDVVFIAKISLKGKTYQQLQEILTPLLKYLNHSR